MKLYGRRPAGAATAAASSSASSVAPASSASSAPASATTTAAPASTATSTTAANPVQTTSSQVAPATTQQQTQPAAGATSTQQPANAPTSANGQPTHDSNPVTSAASVPVSTTSTSIYTSLLVSTAPNGAVVTSTYFSTVVIVPSSISNSGGGSSSSSSGALIGGIAGGISGLVVVLIVGLFFWRRNRRSDDFDGNFDPDRVVRHTGHTDLGGAEVTPYNYDPSAGGATSGHSGISSPTWSGDESMRQYRESQALLGGSIFEAGAATATSGSRHAPTSSDGGSVHPASSHAPSSSHGGGASLVPGLPNTQPYRPMSAKEREAIRQRGQAGLGLASPPEESEDGDVIQHSDGGRVAVPVVETPPHEIPPSYDSIHGNAS